METKDHHHEPGHQHQHDHGGEGDQATMLELLDLDAEVLHSYVAEVFGWVQGLAAGQPRRQILDLGSGSGTGTTELAQRFSEAHVTAVDVSAAMLSHLEAKARRAGVADRVTTLEADLDAGWPATGPADLVWASASMHHLADPARVLTEIFAALRHGGMLAVAELGSMPRFLPDDIGLGRPGMEARVHEVMADARSHEMPTMGSNWAPRLRQAGFAVEAERLFTIDLASPLPAAAGRYAQVVLTRMRSGLADRLDAGDLAVLDTLTGDGPDSILHRSDLTVRTERTVWVGVRP